MCNTSILLFLSFLAFTYAYENGTAVSKCTSHSGNLPIYTKVLGCKKPPCLLPQKQNAVINITFQAEKDIKSMKTFATAYLPALIVGIPIPYNLGANAITCNYLDTVCPIKKGQIVNYQLKMYIETFFPAGTQLPIEFYVEDENSNKVFCLRMKIRVVPPK